MLLHVHCVESIEMLRERINVAVFNPSGRLVNGPSYPSSRDDGYCSQGYYGYYSYILDRWAGRVYNHIHYSYSTYRQN